MSKRLPAAEIILVFALGILLSGCMAQKTGRVTLDPASQQFLDLIGYIILPVEEKIFKEMPPEDRGEFINDFWARRDPDPSTPFNEYRQIYYTRLAVADKAFGKGKPGWKTDRGRIYILLGPPTNIISKAMGDVPYEQGKSLQANPLETGTITERSTEIWVYDNYPEFFAGPLRLVFVDYHSTGDYILQTKLAITPFSMVSFTWDEPNLAKYQWVGEIEMDEKTRGEVAIFDYDAGVEVLESRENPAAFISIDVPYFKLHYRQEGAGFSADLLIAAEVRDVRTQLLTRQEEPLVESFSEQRLKSLFASKVALRKEWILDLPPEAKYIYVSVTDRVRGKRLRKLLEIKE